MVSAEVVRRDQWTILEIVKDDVRLIQNFIGGLEAKTKKKVLSQIQYHAEHGRHPSWERFHCIDNDMFEIKVHQVRILGFFLPNKTMLLTNGCIKKRNKLDSAEIERAKDLFRAYKQNCSNEVARDKRTPKT